MAQYKYVFTRERLARLERLTKTILEEVKPTKEELSATTSAINIVMERLRLVTPKNVEILIAGSVARGTQVRGNFDVDIFLLFPRSMDEEAMEKKGLEIAKRVVKNKDESYSIKYAEHPYTKLVFGNLGLEVEVIPAYKIKDISERSTAVDRTPLHNEFIASALTSRQRDEVRMLKTFMHFHGVYGAEARIEGFSGYLCEILIHHYGSFAKFIEAMANLQLPLSIDVLNKKEYKKGSKEAAAFAGRFGGRLVVLDPTDANRNVAANVSYKALSRLAIASRALIKDSSKGAFYGKGYSDTMPKRKLSKITGSLGVSAYALNFRLPDIAEDIAWQQLKKLRHRLEHLLKENGFAPMLALQNIDERDAVIAFFINAAALKARAIEGPSVLMGEACDRFIASHKSATMFYLKDERICSIEPPKYKGPQEMLRKFFMDKTELLPSYLERKSVKIYVNSMPESCARMVYRAYVWKDVASIS